MEIKFNNDWDNILNELLNKTATKQLFNFIKKERKENNVFPKKSKVFKAFELCSFETWFRPKNSRSPAALEV